MLQVASLVALLVASTLGGQASQSGIGPTSTPLMPRDSLPRCYDLTFGSWTIGSEPLDMYRPLPTRVALTESALSRQGRDREYWGVRWPVDSLRRVAMWHTVKPDSVSIRFPSWWSTGLLLQLAQHGDSLIGRADVYVDYSPFDPTFAHVVAVPVRCPTLPSVGAAGA